MKSYRQSGATGDALPTHPMSRAKPKSMSILSPTWSKANGPFQGESDSHRSGSACSSKRSLVFLAFLGLLLIRSTPAQVTTAQLEGVVQDITEAVVPGVTIVATNEATNISYETVTNETGFYLFPKLTPGRYTVVSELPGFKRNVQPGFPLLIGDTVTLNFTLQVGDITEKVIVTAGSPTVDRVSQSIGNVVKEDQIKDLPLIDRNPLALFYLQAGTNPRNRPQAGGSDQGGVGNVDGLRVEANNVTVEGISAQNPFITFSPAVSMMPVPLEAVGEYRVVTSSASAEYGREAGAQVQIIYNSGTNELHGNLFNFHRNTVLNANNFFNNRQGNERPTFLRNQFGFSLGGP